MEPENLNSWTRFPGTESGTGTVGTVFRNRNWNRNRAPLLNSVETQRKPFWVLPEDLCKKDPCNFSTGMFVSKVGNPCPTLGQLLASRILHTLLVGKTARNPQSTILYTELLKSWPTLKDANSPPHGKLQRSSLQWSSCNTQKGFPGGTVTEPKTGTVSEPSCAGTVP